MGMVAATAHHSGRRKSAKRPRIVKTIQNIFFCIGSARRTLSSRRRNITQVSEAGSCYQDVLLQKFQLDDARGLGPLEWVVAGLIATADTLLGFCRKVLLNQRGAFPCAGGPAFTLLNCPRLRVSHLCVLCKGWELQTYTLSHFLSKPGAILRG
jgi:hypothetical protein